MASMTDQSEEESVSVSPLWVGLEEHPALYSNLFLCQTNGPDIILTFGLGTPPVFEPDMPPEQQLDLLRSMQYVPVRVNAKLALSGVGLEQLRTVIDDAMANRERQAGA
jgi:hypothetical protein